MAHHSNRTDAARHRKNGREETTTEAVRFLRNYLIGLWAASELRLKDQDADRYAVDVARLGERSPSDDAVVKLVRADIAAAGGHVDPDFVNQRLRGFERSAMRAIGARPALVAYRPAA